MEAFNGAVSIPSPKNMEGDILKTVRVQGLLNSHDSPKVENMSANNLETGRGSNSPLIATRRLGRT
jgi:hypothetical protein